LEKLAIKAFVFYNETAGFFIQSLIKDGVSKKVSQFIIKLMSIYSKKFILMNKKHCKSLKQ